MGAARWRSIRTSTSPSSRPWKPTGWTETVIESILYLLWDLGLKVGHSAAQRRRGDPRSPPPTRRSAPRSSRRATSGATRRCTTRSPARFWKEVVAGNVAGLRQGEARRARRAPQADGRQPLCRRAQRQGGQRRPARSPHALLDRQICLSAARPWPSWSRSACSRADELRQFHRAERFLWAVRCHLHLVAGRAEERLTFDYQREIAARMNYADRPGKSAVERFMRHYFLHAKTVGDLTGVFLAHLDEKFARRGRRFGLPAFRRRPRQARRLHARSRPARRSRRRFLRRRIRCG